MVLSSCRIAFPDDRCNFDLARRIAENPLEHAVLADEEF